MANNSEVKLRVKIGCWADWLGRDFTVRILIPVCKLIGDQFIGSLSFKCIRDIAETPENNPGIFRELLELCQTEIL